MTLRIQDLVDERARADFIGRSDDLALLLRSLDDDAPPVWHVHGVAGIGKTRLLDAFAAAATSRGATTVRLDCRDVEPTPRAFLSELGAAIGQELTSVEDAADQLAQCDGRVVLLLDTYEVFRLLDTWLRQTFVPALAAQTRVVTAGREPLPAAWAIEPGWAGLTRSLALGPLRDDAAVELLVHGGVAPDAAKRINRITRGHPLALQLASVAAAEYPGALPEGAALPRVVEALASLYLADIDDPLTRRAVEAAAVVRRATRPLLAAMLGADVADEAFDRLRRLPFVEHARDGLVMHAAVQAAIAASLSGTDPGRHRDLRRAAWRHLHAEARAVGPAELWRSTADMLFLLENPSIREGFFPSDAHRYVVETGEFGDEAAIREISLRHKGAASTQALMSWWDLAPQTFWVVRDPQGVVAGYFVVFVADDFSPELLRRHPLLHGWLSHLRRDPVTRNQRVLFCPSWLSRDDGEAPSAVQGALWLAIKRLYMELRPQLRRVYTAQDDLAAHITAMRRLGFRRLPDCDVEFDGVRSQSLLLDLGPGSVDGWLAGLVAAELGIAEDHGILDVAARELVLGGRRVGLTPLEFGVMQHLTTHESRVVSRAELLADVWGYDYEGGSNVVDVVVRSLRKKLADRAELIEAVRGVGYRLREA